MIDMPGNQPIQVIQRVASVLYAVAGVEGGCSVNQVSKITGIKVPTVHRIIRSLQMEGFLKRLDQPIRYTLGPAIFDLNRLDEQQHLLTVSAEELIRAHATLISANLVLVVHEDLVCYQRLRCLAERPGRINRLRRHLLEPYIRATTLLCLAYATSDQIRSFYKKHPFETEGKPFWKTRENLESFLAEVRRASLAIPPIPDPIFFRVAVPVFSQNQELLAAVGGYISVSAGTQKHKQLVQLCQQAARAIMNRLESNHATQSDSKQADKISSDEE